MKIHLIAIGGSAMHNLAMALHHSGHQVSGSDDEIFEPSRSRLAAKGLLPAQMGWNPQRINNELDAIILGMHARADNPELLKARELGLRIYSYPEYLQACSTQKKRIVIGGSHGKTTVTSMVLHVLNDLNISADYMVGAQLKGFETMVQISEAPIMVLEGDEYLSSPIDRRPKFHLYKPHIALLTGVAWDHINVFPTFEEYLRQFELFIETIELGGSLIYFVGDLHLENLVKRARKDIEIISYDTPDYQFLNGKTYIRNRSINYPLQIFGRHNLQNLEGARHVCAKLGVDAEQFWISIGQFTGADKRLERLESMVGTFVYKDFAHSPSKLKATVQAVVEQHPDREVHAYLELHTFSSLNKRFLGEYAHCIDEAHCATVYYNPLTLQHKQLDPLTPNDVKTAFERPDLVVSTRSSEIIDSINSKKWNDKVLLWMTSGNFDGCSIENIAEGLSV